MKPKTSERQATQTQANISAQVVARAERKAEDFLCRIKRLIAKAKPKLGGGEFRPERLQGAVFSQAVADIESYLSRRKRLRIRGIENAPPKTEKAIEIMEDAISAAEWMFGEDRNPDYLFSRTAICGNTSNSPGRIWATFSETDQELLLDLLTDGNIRLCREFRIPAGEPYTEVPAAAATEMTI